MYMKKGWLIKMGSSEKVCFFNHIHFFLYVSISSAKQTIHMKCQELFALKNKKKKLSSAAVVIGVLRVNTCTFR